MKKIFWFFTAGLLLPYLQAETLKTKYNPHTGRPDFYTVLSSATLPFGSTFYIQNTNALQSGATFYVSSGTVNGSFFSINGVGYTWPSTDGSIGQFLQTNGSKVLSFAAAGGGGGSSTLAVGTGTASNFTNSVTSPTAVISFLGAQFKSAASGTTNFISLDVSSVTLLGQTIPAASIAAGSLGSSVIASSIAASGIAAGTYGSATQVSSITVGGDGRVTSATNITISLTNSNLQAGTYSNVTIPAANVAAGSLGASVIASSLTATGVTAGTYGSATQVSSFTVDAQGRITGAANVTITAGSGDITDVFNVTSGAAQQVTMADGHYLDASTLTPSSREGIILSTATDCTPASYKGQLCYDTDDFTITVGTGAGTKRIGKIIANLLVEEAQFFSAQFPQYNKVNGTTVPVSGLAYDASAQESAHWKFIANDYVQGNLTLTLYWYADTATSGDVVWGAQIMAITPNTDTQDIETDAWATEQTVTTSHLGTVGQRLHSVNLTISNLDSLANGDHVIIRIFRKGQAAADTMTGDAILTYATLSY